MKKNLLLIIAISILSAMTMEAQNTHWAYYTSNVSCDITSAVTVVHSSGMSYLVQSNDNNILIVTEIDPSTMAITGQSHYFNTNSTLQYLHINGAFELDNGLIVVYGKGCYNQSAYTSGVAFLLDVSTNNMLNSYIFSGQSSFKDGCSGYDNYNVNIAALLTNEGKIIVLTDQLNVITNHYFSYPYYRGRITDISWDFYNNVFLFSGLYLNGAGSFPYLGYFKFANGNNPDFFFVNGFRFYNTTSSLYSDDISLHTIIDDSHILLFCNLQDGDYQVMCLSLIENYFDAQYPAPNFPVSKFYYFQTPKLTAYDMVYDPNTSFVTLLGNLTYCDNTNIIAQVDPYTLSNLKVGQIMDNNPPVPCATTLPPFQNQYGNGIVMERLTLNPYSSCPTVLSTGYYATGHAYENAGDNTAFLTQIYDIGMSLCDDFLNYLTLNITESAIPLAPAYSTSFFFVPASPTITNLGTVPFSVSSICQDPAYCAKSLMQQSREMPSNRTEADIKMITPDKFICDNFVRSIDYRLYDATGKVIIEGSTVNQKITSLNISQPGLYILTATDNTGNHVTKKTVIVK